MDTPITPQSDPLYRIFIPVERPLGHGAYALKTSDGRAYTRGVDGAIRRADGGKRLGKNAKKVRQRAQRRAG